MNNGHQDSYHIKHKRKKRKKKHRGRSLSPLSSPPRKVRKSNKSKKKHSHRRDNTGYQLPGRDMDVVQDKNSTIQDTSVRVQDKNCVVQDTSGENVSTQDSYNNEMEVQVSTDEIQDTVNRVQDLV